MFKPLEYYYANGTHVKFNKYTIDIWGVIRNKKGETMTYTENKGEYKICSVYDDSGKRRGVSVGRAIASTFLGPPPTLEHTADHKNKNRSDNILDNIRWLNESEQKYNRDMPETNRASFIIVKDGEEKTCKEWVEHLKDEKNSFGREYTKCIIEKYAQNKRHGFSYKEYHNLDDEMWKKITKSENTMGRWEISDMNRVKYITKYAENVISGERLGLSNGYPVIGINGKSWLCHILSFMTFFPDEYANKKLDEMILHENDDKMDFRPYKLRLGTQSENITDAHDNGKYDGTKSARMKCASYIDDVFEKEHASQDDAMRYLKSKGYTKARVINISIALNSEYMTNFAYGRTWKRVD